MRRFARAGDAFRGAVAGANRAADTLFRVNLIMQKRLAPLGWAALINHMSQIFRSEMLQRA